MRSVRSSWRSVAIVGGPVIPASPPEGREILRRLTNGDLQGQFQAALDAVSEADPLLGDGEADPDD